MQCAICNALCAMRHVPCASRFYPELLKQAPYAIQLVNSSDRFEVYLVKLYHAAVVSVPAEPAMAASQISGGASDAHSAAIRVRSLYDVSNVAGAGGGWFDPDRTTCTSFIWQLTLESGVHADGDCWMTSGVSKGPHRV
jgi:hypothetical protein